MRLHPRRSSADGEPSGSRARLWHRLAIPPALRRHPALSAGVAGGVAVVVAAAVTGFALARDADPGSRDAAGPFVLPSLAATPTTAPTGTTPTGGEPGPASSLPDSVGTSVAAAGQVQPLAAGDAIAELWRSGRDAPALDIDRNGHIRAVSAAPGTAIPAPPGTPATIDPVTVAAAFVNRYGEGFGLLAGQHAAVSLLHGVPGGDRVVRFQQQIGGVPVMGGDVVVAVDPTGGVVSASGEAPVAGPASSAARVPAQDAAATALTTTALRTGLAADQLAVTRSALWYFDPRVLGVPGQAGLRLTWWVTVAGVRDGTDLQSIFVDASDGAVVLAYSEQHNARNRLICDVGNVGINVFDPGTYMCSDAPGGPPVVRREGQGASGVVDVNQAYDMLGATYDFYLNNVGRDSLDGAGLPLRASVRACRNDIVVQCPMVNAFWDGQQMVFGQGFAAADDVVAHELTHGMTTYTSNLFYFAESGGINEGLSDIMGEFFDQTRTGDNDSLWLVGEDLSIGAIRSMADPTSFGDPDRVGTFAWNQALANDDDNFGVHHLSGVADRAAYLLAVGGVQNGQTVTGIGVPKSIQIWYRLMFLLPSGAEMADLVRLLPFACRSVIGVVDITAADCIEASDATLATAMNVPSGHDGNNLSYGDDDDCDVRGMPTRTLFGDDFERGGGRWTLGAPWQAIPSANLPSTFANSGKGSLYIDENDGNTVKPRAELDEWISPPAGGLSNLRVSWAENIRTPGSLSIPSGLDVLVASQGVETEYSTGGAAVDRTLGYAKRVKSLATIPNVPFRIILAAESSPVAENELLIDDVRVYECLPGLNGPPEQVAAQSGSGGTSATVTWAAPAYTAPGAGPAQYEVSVLPAPTGYTGPIRVPSSTSSTTISGLDPVVRYEIFVRALSASGVGGVSATAYAPSAGAVDCDILSTSGGVRGRNWCFESPPLPPLGR